MLTTAIPGDLDEFFIEVEIMRFKLRDDLKQLIALGARDGHESIEPPLGDRSTSSGSRKR